MRVLGIIADLPVADVQTAKAFYVDYLGLDVEELGLDWVTRCTSAESGAQLQLVSTDASAPLNPVVSVKVDDVEAAYVDAVTRGYEIVHPLTTEPWGVTRFFVRAPDGNVLNVVQDRA